MLFFDLMTFGQSGWEVCAGGRLKGVSKSPESEIVLSVKQQKDYEPPLLTLPPPAS